MHARDLDPNPRSSFVQLRLTRAVPAASSGMPDQAPPGLEEPETSDPRPAARRRWCPRTRPGGCSGVEREANRASFRITHWVVPSTPARSPRGPRFRRALRDCDPIRFSDQIENAGQDKRSATRITAGRERSEARARPQPACRERVGESIAPAMPSELS